MERQEFERVMGVTMDLRSRVDQVLKDNEAAVVWSDSTGFQLVSNYPEDENLPEEIIALLLFIERFCLNDEFAEEFLNWSEEKSEEAE